MTENEKLYVRAFAFITSCIIVIACIYYSCIYTSATKGGYQFDTQYSFTDDFSIPTQYYDSSDYGGQIGLSSSVDGTNYLTIIENGLNFKIINDNLSNGILQAYNNADHFVTLYNGSDVIVMVLPQDSFICKTTYDIGIYYSNIDTIPLWQNIRGCFCYKSYTTSTTSSDSVAFVNYSVVNVDSANYGCAGLSQFNGYNIVATDLPLKQSNVAYSTDLTTLNGATDIDNPISDSSSEQPNNNLYLVNSDFTFSNTKFVAPYNSSIFTGSIYPNGSITFSGIPNAYQYDNKDRFTLTFGFQFRYNVTYQNQGQSDYGPFKRTNTLLNSKKKYSTTLHYSNSGVETIDIPLTQFISNGNSVSWTMEEILSHMIGEYDYETLLRQSQELTSVEYNAFDIVCNAYISSGSDSSGDYSEWYNPMSNKGYTTSENMKINKNPYSASADEQGDSDYYGDLDAPGVAGNGSGGGSSSSIANSSTGEIVINNYNEVNVGDNSSSGGSGSGSGAPSSSEEAGLAFNFYNTFNPFSLIFNKMVGDNETISDETVDTIGANSFISFLSSTFSFLPLTFWEKFTWYIGACLGILIVAVVLRVILDLL